MVYTPGSDRIPWTHQFIFQKGLDDQLPWHFVVALFGSLCHSMDIASQIRENYLR